jgi:hypothetical protein
MEYWSFCVLLSTKRPGSPLGAGTLVGNMENFSSPLTRTTFHAILLWGKQSKFLWVLIDSGTNERFMDATLTSELGIPTQPFSIPMDVSVLDGRSTGRVTHNTTAINLRVSGNLSKAI